MNILSDKRLIDATDKFLAEFFELAHQINIEEKRNSTHPQLVSDKRNDSYAFNYSFAECIANTEFVKNQKDYMYPLMDMGFIQEIIKKFFNNNIKGVNKKLMYVIKNHDKQWDGLNYYLTDFTKSVAMVDDFKINPAHFKDTTQPLTLPCKTKETTYTFKLRNSGNFHVSKCVVKMQANKINDVEVYGEVSGDGEKHTNKIVSINSREDATLGHFKHVADVNSFFGLLDAVVDGIKERKREEKLK